MKASSLGFVIPGMRTEYGLSFSRAAVLPFVALLGTTLGSLIWGSLADIYGRRAAILLAAVLFVGTSICGAMPSFFWNIVICFIMGRNVAGCECASRRNTPNQTSRLVPGFARRYWDDRRLLRDQRVFRTVATVLRLANHVAPGISYGHHSHCSQSVASGVRSISSSDGTIQRSRRDVGPLRLRHHTVASKREIETRRCRRDHQERHAHTIKSAAAAWIDSIPAAHISITAPPAKSSTTP
jgi:hypothetical protein